MDAPHDDCPCMESCPLNRAMELMGGSRDGLYKARRSKGSIAPFAVGSLGPC